jgi:WD40 repeat protein
MKHSPTLALLCLISLLSLLLTGCSLLVDETPSRPEANLTPHYSWPSSTDELILIRNGVAPLLAVSPDGQETYYLSFFPIEPEKAWQQPHLWALNTLFTEGGLMVKFSPFLHTFTAGQASFHAPTGLLAYDDDRGWVFLEQRGELLHQLPTPEMRMQFLGDGAYVRQTLYRPAVHPTGEWVVWARSDGLFASDAPYNGQFTNHIELYQVADGQTKLLLEGVPLPVKSSAWSPDGTKLAYALRETSPNMAEEGYAGDGGVYLLDLTTGGVERLGSVPYLSRVAWSADGRWLAGEAWRGGLYLFDPTTAVSHKLEPYIETFAWSPHGASLVWAKKVSSRRERATTGPSPFINVGQSDLFILHDLPHGRVNRLTNMKIEGGIELEWLDFSQPLFTSPDSASAP